MPRIPLEGAVCLQVEESQMSRLVESGGRAPTYLRLHAWPPGFHS
jgi:hypothetical protein